MKDLAIVQLKKQPDLVGTDGQLHKNRYLSLIQMGIAPKVVSGVHKLAQFITKLLLTTQGSDLFDPTYGSSLLFLLKKSQSQEALADLRASIATHMRDVRRQVIASQTNLSLPSDERLQDLQLISVDYDPVNVKFNIEVKLSSEAGDGRTLNLENLIAG